MRNWSLPEVETPHGARSPVVLHSKDGAERAVLIELRAGEALGDHGVKESALLVVLDGTVRVEAGDESVDGDAGALVHFEPDERHSVTSDGGAQAPAVARAVARRGALPRRPSRAVGRQRFLGGPFCSLLLGAPLPAVVREAVDHVLERDEEHGVDHGERECADEQAVAAVLRPAR